MTQRNPRRIRVNLSTPAETRRREVARYYEQRYQFWTRNGYLPEEADELARFNISLSQNRTFVRGMVSRRRRRIENMRRRGLTGSNLEEGSRIYRALWEYYQDESMETQITQLYLERFGIRGRAA